MESIFLTVSVVFFSGTSEEKARMMFDMYDLKGQGRLTQEEFKVMLQSFVELANERIEEAQIKRLIQTILHDIGLDQQASITFNDFQRILSNYEDDLKTASLGIQGKKRLNFNKKGNDKY